MPSLLVEDDNNKKPTLLANLLTDIQLLFCSFLVKLQSTLLFHFLFLLYIHVTITLAFSLLRVQALRDLYRHLTPIQRLTIARHPNRPTVLDYILDITEKVVCHS